MHFNSKEALEALKEKLIRKYPSEKVEVDIWREGTPLLLVGFQNPSFWASKITQYENKQVTRQIAFFIKKNYPDIQHVEMITITFVRTEKVTVIPLLFHTNKSLNYTENFNVKEDLASDEVR